MDEKTGYGLVLMAMTMIFQLVAKAYGVDGSIETTVQASLALVTLLIAGKGISEALKAKKEP